MDYAFLCGREPEVVGDDSCVIFAVGDYFGSAIYFKSWRRRWRKLCHANVVTPCKECIIINMHLVLYLGSCI